MDDFARRPPSDPGVIFGYRDGLYAGDLLTAAIVWLDFFSGIAASPADASEICRRFEICERPTDVMITLFVAMGLLERRGDRVHLSASARDFLVRGSPWYVGPYFEPLAERPVCRDFVDVLRTDRPAPWAGLSGARDWHQAMEEPNFAKRFTAAMDSRGAYLAQALARSLDLSDRELVLDVAGGSGVYACALVAANPGLRAVVLEKSPVDTVAARAIADRDLSARVSVVAADMFTAPWPCDADAHLFSNVLHDWPTPTVATLLQRSFDALAPGGRLIVHDAFIDRGKSGPLAVAEYSALLMHATLGKCHSLCEYDTLLAEAGFRDVAYAATAAGRGRLVGRKPR